MTSTDRPAESLASQLARPVLLSRGAQATRLVNHVAGELAKGVIRCDRCEAVLFDIENGPHPIMRIAAGTLIQTNEPTDLVVPRGLRTECRR